MKPIRIGVINNQDDNDINHQFLPAGYRRGVERFGGTVVPVDFYTPREQLRSLADSLDGLLFSGGADIAPERYGREKEPVCGRIFRVRDALEMELFELAWARRLPIMGICRGIQLINVAMGGTLIQDIPTHVGKECCHALPQEPAPRHEVRLVPGSAFSRLLGEKTETNSYHHQAVEQLAPGLRIAGHAPDGVVEAVEAERYPFLMAVQWHPETTLDKDPDSEKLFRAFLAHC